MSWIYIHSIDKKVRLMVDYDWKIGLKKTAKNMAWMFGVPALLYGLSQVEVIVPKEWLPVAVPVAAAISYGIKNWYENK